MIILSGNHEDNFEGRYHQNDRFIIIFWNNNRSEVEDCFIKVKFLSNAALI
jgi:hypothetical protein